MNVSFVKSENMVIRRELYNIDQGRIGVSQMGALDLLSTGFSHCLGVIICSTDERKKGGFVAHIRGGGAGGPDYNKDKREYSIKKGIYYLNAIQKSLELARKYVDKSNKLYVVLFRGEAEANISFKDLKDQNTKITDLRPEAERASALLLNPETKTLLLWKGGVTTNADIDKVENSEQRNPKVQSDVTFQYLKDPMPLKVFD